MYFLDSLSSRRELNVSFPGLDNFLLEKEYPFNEKKAAAIKYFLEQCIPPICLVAHNGLRFDFPLLQEELKNFTEVRDFYP